MLSVSCTSDFRFSFRFRRARPRPLARQSPARLRCTVPPHISTPDSLALLSNLSRLTICSTGVSGSIPSFVSQLTDLTSIDLSFNSLEGSIPVLLAKLPSLARLSLSRNRLSGPVAPLLSLIDLRLSHNNFFGAIPARFAAVSFAHLDLSRNSFSGDASGVFSKGKPLQHLDLSRNSFAFSLTTVELPEQLSYVDLSHNAIRGRIPAQVAGLAGLQLFNVNYNKMCGVVPTGGNMASFNAYSYRHNKCLCGKPLPSYGHRFY